MKEERHITLIDEEDLNDPPFYIVFENHKVKHQNYFLVVKESLDPSNNYRVVRLFSTEPPKEALKHTDTETVIVLPVGLDLFNNDEVV